MSARKVLAEALLKVAQRRAELAQCDIMLTMNDLYLQDADLVLTELVAAGLVILPKVPTEEMLSAFGGIAVCAGDTDRGYEEMLAAAPKP